MRYLKKRTIKMKTKKNKLMLANAIICYTTAGLYLLMILAFAFNIFGVYDICMEMLTSIYPNYAVTMDLTMVYIQEGLLICLLISFGNFYLRGYKRRYGGREFASRVMMTAFLQLICGTFVSPIIGFIIAFRMRKENVVIPATHNEVGVEKSAISPNKLQAMTEAVERLRHLRESGVISEEEYYASLNKILEG